MILVKIGILFGCFCAICGLQRDLLLAEEAVEGCTELDYGMIVETLEWERYRSLGQAAAVVRFGGEVGWLIVWDTYALIYRAVSWLVSDLCLGWSPTYVSAGLWPVSRLVSDLCLGWSLACVSAGLWPWPVSRLVYDLCFGWFLTYVSAGLWHVSRLVRVYQWTGTEWGDQGQCDPCLGGPGQGDPCVCGPGTG